MAFLQLTPWGRVLTMLFCSLEAESILGFITLPQERHFLLTSLTSEESGLVPPSFPKMAPDQSQNPNRAIKSMGIIKSMDMNISNLQNSQTWRLHLITTLQFAYIFKKIASYSSNSSQIYLLLGLFAFCIPVFLTNVSALARIF